MIKHLHFGECDSTQDIIKEQIDQGEKSPVLISTDHQKNGRGRGENLWTSMPGTLCFSLTVDPSPIPSFTAIELSVLISKFFEGSILKLKWPNDLLNKHDKKCCGILVQSFGGKMAAGIGLNLFSDHFDFGGIYESEFAFDKKAWSAEIADFILKHRYKEIAVLIKDWEERSAHMNSLVMITEGNTIHEGIFKGLGEHGQAIVLTGERTEQIYNGTLRALSSGH